MTARCRLSHWLGVFTLMFAIPAAAQHWAGLPGGGTAPIPAGQGSGVRGNLGGGQTASGSTPNGGGTQAPPAGGGAVAPSPSNPTPGSAPSGNPPALRPSSMIRRDGAAGGGGGGYPSGKKPPTVDLASWETWWSLNGGRYLNMRAVSRRASQDSWASDQFVGNSPATQGSEGRGQRLRERMANALRPALRDDDPAIRAEALIALGRMGQTRFLHEFVDALSDSNVLVREAACLGLGMLGERSTANLLAAVLDDSNTGRRLTGARHAIDTPTRAAAAFGLGFLAEFVDYRGTPANDILLKTAEAWHASIELNVAALTALALSGGRDNAPRLAAILCDVERPALVRAQAASALGCSKDRSAASAMAMALRDESVHVRRAAAAAIGRLATPRDDAVLNELLRVAASGADAVQSQFALIALGEIGGPTAQSYLLDLARRRPAPRTGAFVALSLGVLGFEHTDADRAAATQALRGVFRDARREDERPAAMLALGLLGDYGAADEIRAVLEGRGATASRAAAAQSLGLMRSVASLPALEFAARYAAAPPIRASATQALGVLGDDDALLALKDLLGSRRASFIVSGAAVQALGVFGDSAATQDLAAIVHRSSGAPPDVRRAAIAALGILGDRGNVPAMNRFVRGVNYVSMTGRYADVLARLR